MFRDGAVRHRRPRRRHTETLDVGADVSLGPDPAGGFRLTGITLNVSGEVDGLDAAGFQQAAEEAKAGCPVSKALTGVEITLNVT